VSQSYVLACADGKRVALHMSSPEKFWQALADAIGQPGLLRDPRFASRDQRIANQEALIDLLAPIFRSRSREAWCTLLEAHDVPHAPVYDASEALEDPQARHLGLLVSAEHPQMGTFRTVRSPVSYDGERPGAVRPPPS
jgi:crotonobetainyl-CoA:carnitine CoA-transferase CaiB-like acyl-CoA transferase